MRMSFWLWGALLAFCGGALISFFNYLLSRAVLQYKATFYTAFSVVRQIFQIGYLVVLYFVASYTPWDALILLVGGVLGITLPMFFFTWRLLRLSDSQSKKGADASDKEIKEEEKHG